MGPLEGIRVVDLTTYLATPTTGRTLAEWGADVVKVEAAAGDPARVTQAPVFNMPMSDDENLAFDVGNLGKRFVSIDLKSDFGMQAMQRLLADADIFLTNMRAKSLKKLGLDWETLHARYPRLIMGHGLGYGKRGAEKDEAGFDATCYMARGGLYATTVNRGDFPMIPTNAYGDLQASLFLAAGLCAAVAGRARSGEGDYVTCALQHAAVYALSIGMVSAQYGNAYPKSRLEVVCPFNNVYVTGDQKYVAMCDPEYDRDFEKIMRLIGREDVLTNDDLRTCARMNDAGLNAEVVGILDEALARMTAEEVLALFKGAEVPVELCQTPLDVYQDQNVWDNDYLVNIAYPAAKRMIPTIPVQLASLPVPSYLPSGKLGSATVSVMEELGYGRDEIEDALARGDIKGETSLDDLV